MSNPLGGPQRLHVLQEVDAAAEAEQSQAKCRLSAQVVALSKFVRGKALQQVVPVEAAPLLGIDGEDGARLILVERRLSTLRNVQVGGIVVSGRWYEEWGGGHWGGGDVTTG